MYWLIAILGILVFIGITYHMYTKPRLPEFAQHQRRLYVNSFYAKKKLLYQMNPISVSHFKEVLQKEYYHAGNGRFYHPTPRNPAVIIILEQRSDNIIVYLFCTTNDDLTRTTWKIMRIKNNIGGATAEHPHG